MKKNNKPGNKLPQQPKGAGGGPKNNKPLEEVK